MTVSTRAPHLAFGRTFLAPSLPVEVVGVTPQRIVDIYLPSDPEVSPRVRVRQVDGSLDLTWRIPALPAERTRRYEQTIALSQGEVMALQAGSRRRIEKDRYVGTIDGRAAVVDEYLGDLAGLVLVSFELDSAEELWAFEPPEWCGADVTKSERVAGARLAGRRYDDLRADLGRLSDGRVPQQ